MLNSFKLKSNFSQVIRTTQRKYLIGSYRVPGKLVPHWGVKSTPKDEKNTTLMQTGGFY